MNAILVDDEVATARLLADMELMLDEMDASHGEYSAAIPLCRPAAA